jgi:hypothetical protein
MSHRAFVSINRMRAGHTSHKASLNRFNIVSTTEYECGDVLQTEDHIFWDCKLYEEQHVTMLAILSENRKKEYPKSVTELLRRLKSKGKKIYARRISFFFFFFIFFRLHKGWNQGPLDTVAT